MYEDVLAATRRIFVLRALVGLNGRANESLLHELALASVTDAMTRDDIRADLDHLIAHGCIRDEWRGKVRTAIITERGEDAAYGRVAIEGVKRTRWDGPAE